MPATDHERDHAEPDYQTMRHRPAKLSGSTGSVTPAPCRAAHDAASPGGGERAIRLASTDWPGGALLARNEPGVPESVNAADQESSASPRSGMIAASSLWILYPGFLTVLGLS